MADLNYFFDSVSGNDANNGTTWALAFKTLDALHKIAWSTGLVRVYFKAGVYWPINDKTITSGSNQEQNTHLIGVGPVVFKNPNRKFLTLVPHSYSFNNSTTGDIHFWNITFDTPVGAEMLKATLGGTNDAAWTYIGTIIKFNNCSFRNNLFSSITATTVAYSPPRQLYFDNCTCMAPYTLTATDATLITSLPTTHVATPVTLTGTDPVRIYAGAARKNTETGILLNNGMVVCQDSDIGKAGANIPPFMAYNKTGTWVYFDHTELMTIGLRFSNWFDDVSYLDGRASINTGLNEIAINLGVSARVLSPVYMYGVVSTLKKIHVGASEVFSAAYDNAVVDSTHDTTARTIEYRASLTEFLPDTDEVTLPWITVERDASMNISNIQYVQFRMTLDATAA